MASAHTQRFAMLSNFVQRQFAVELAPGMGVGLFMASPCSRFCGGEELLLQTALPTTKEA